MKLMVREVASLFGVPEETVHRWIQRGEIPAHRVNGQHRFSRAELLEWATTRGFDVSPDLVGASAAGALPLLSDTLDAGGVFHDVGGTDRTSVLHAIVGLLRLPEDADRDTLFQVLMAREELGSTAIGDGIAIPHVRNPIVFDVDLPTITLCYLAAPVDFGALDGQPVRVLFTLVSPTVRVHLHLLSRLAFALHDAGVREVLQRSGSRDEVLAAVRLVEARVASR